MSVCVAVGQISTQPTVAPADGSDKSSAEMVDLPVFTVRDTRGGDYHATEATSTTRISIPLQEIAQSLSVVTHELIDDTQGARPIDVARFVTPIMESTSTAGDSYSVRGFRTSVKFIDGVNVGAIANSMWSDQTNLERMEIIKGPNAILVPGGLAGGISNQITKSPKFESFTKLSLRARSYLGSEASLDANRMFGGGRSAARLVATIWDSDGYFDGQFRRGWLLAPSFAHRCANGNEVVLKMETLENKESNGMGVVLDPAVGTRVGGYARKHPLLPRDNLFPPLDSYRYRRETRVSAELRFKVAGDVAARLWLLADHAYFSTPGPGGAFSGGDQGSPNPLTGEWEPFKVFTYNASTGAVTAVALAPSTSTLFVRQNQQFFTLRFDEVHLKNDYVKEYHLGSSGRGTTIAGLNANGQLNVKAQNWRITRPSLDYASGHPVGADEPHAEVLARDKGARQVDGQVFLYQRVNLFADQLIISAGGSLFTGVLKRTDHSNLPPQGLNTTRNRVFDTNLGVIYQPRPGVSLFTGYNRVDGALPQSFTAGEYGTSAFKVGVGDQLEYGVKTSWLNGHITASAAYFSIFQSNSQVNNPRFQSLPFTEPAYLYVDQRNRGWEIEVAAQLARGFELVGNFTHMRMREANDLPSVMVPDKAAAFFAKYTFLFGMLRGLGLSLGLHYEGVMPGDKSYGVTSAGVPIQPSFYLAPRTIMQGGISYRRERWNFGIMVMNLLDKDYIQASSTRGILLPGEPRNYSATLELKW